MSTHKILIIDDDDALRSSLAEQLTLDDEFSTDLAATGADGIEKTCRFDYDMILLDMSLPDMDGHDACRMMRQAGLPAPIIMLTATNTDVDATFRLGFGANDYVTKPFKFSVLLARIRAQLRQRTQSDDDAFTVGPYIFIPSAKSLTTQKGERIRLTDKENQILKFLYHSGAAAVARNVLLREVWGYNSGVTTHTLETHIYRLRQKIENDPANAEILLTESGGYRLGG